MEISPHPYKNNIMLADEHTDVLQAAVTTKTCISELLVWFFQRFRATEGSGALPDIWEDWNAEMVVEQWNWKITYQHRIRKPSTNRDQSILVDMVDAFVVAKRRFYTKRRGLQVHVEQLCFFADAALSSVVTLQRRIRAIESVYPHAFFIVVTCRNDTLLRPLIDMDRVRLVAPHSYPDQSPSRSEELPDEWFAGDTIYITGGTLDEHGFHFPSTPEYPTLTSTEFAEAMKASGGEPQRNDLPNGFESLL